MALPDNFVPQFLDTDRGIGCVIYLIKKDNPNESCGVMRHSIEEIKNLEIRDFNKFKTPPTSWDDLKQLKLPKLNLGG